MRKRLPKSQRFRTSASIRNSKPAFRVKDIGVNSKKETGEVSTTSYSKTWFGITDKELAHVLTTIKRMEKAGWVIDSEIEAVDNPNGRKLNTIKWTYKVIR